jgi:hypothetical protein
VGSGSSIALSPVCIVLKPEQFVSLKKIFPFDTQAYGDHVFDNYLQKNMKLEDFSVGYSLKDASRLISVFFGNNKRYYLGEAKHGLDIPFNHMVLNSYYNLITATEGQGFSDERHTIEVHHDNTLRLPERLLGIVVPEVVIEHEEIIDVISKWGCEMLTYSTYLYVSPGQYKVILLERVRDMLVKYGYL